MRLPDIEPIYVGQIGCGSVGGGVVNVFREGRFNPYNIILKTVAVRDPSKVRDVQFPDSTTITNDAVSIINDPDIDIVVEVMGGTKEAREYTYMGLEAGKHWVTANKALLGEDLPKLFNSARENNVSLSFEASVCGAIPVIQNLRDYLRLQNVTRIAGILNGTTNYILSRMEDGLDFKPALEEAQGLGIAEANHILDTGGYDTRSKLAILASMASGMHIKPEYIPCRGITEVRQEDISFAREFRQGYAVKLLGIAEKHAEGVWSVQVTPALISKNNPLASVGGKLNSVTIEGDLSGPLTFTGFGASREPTAGAVVADILHAGEHVRFGTPDFLPVLEEYPETSEPDDILSAGYIRVDLLDEVGTFARVSQLLAGHGLSMQRILQQGDPYDIDGKQYTTDIITLHQAYQNNIDAGVEQLSRSRKVQGKAFYMPIAD